MIRGGAYSAAAFREKRGRFPVAPKIERTIDGIVFASKGEAQEYATLKLREKIGEISDLELQPKFPVYINGERLCVYKADFSFFDCRLGRTVIVDRKSSGTAKDAAYKLRKRAAELSHKIKIDEIVR